MSDSDRPETTDSDIMNRRRFLTMAGGIGAATAGGTFIVASSDTAQAAEVDAEDHLSSTVLSGTSDSGRIDDVTLTASGSFEWSGLDKDAKYAEVCVYVRSPSGEWERLTRAVNDDIQPRSTSTEAHHFADVGGSLFENTSWHAEAFPHPKQGQTAQKDLDVRVRVIVYENDKGVKTDMDHTVTVKITNRARSIDATSEIDGKVHTSPEKGNGKKKGGIPDECSGEWCTVDSS